MKKFRYLFDPLFLIGCACYLMNRFWWKPHTHNFFLRSYFNDCFLIPCALPLLLLFHRWLKLRSHDGMPTLREVGLHLGVWAVLLEIFGPHLMQRSTGDVWDIAAYSAGAIVSLSWWNRGRISELITSRHEF